MLTLSKLIGILVVAIGITKTTKQQHSSPRKDMVNFQDTVKSTEYSPTFKYNDSKEKE